MEKNNRRAGFFTVLLILLQMTLFPMQAYSSFSLKERYPFVGAQVFIEPGLSPERIDNLFRVMKENGLEMCRIRMFESYMNYNGRWDFSLFDHAFHAAHKYGIRIYATFFPATEKTDIGGWKFPATYEQEKSFATYIRELVMHYKAFPALQGWVLINEPYVDKLPNTPWVNEQRVAWDKQHPIPEQKSNGYPVLMTTHEQAFIQDLTTYFLGWIATEIKKYDTKHDLHVNPPEIFNIVDQCDFPAWQSFLTSLGGSAHASWHFGMFGRSQYALAMLANAEILRSGAGALPWFMTELQGGNNTYSGGQALCPTPQEIAQWLWIVLGCEGKGGLFWTLNPRSSGIEAGEWAMVNYQDKPSDRLLAARDVATAIKGHPDLFSRLQVVSSGVDVLYIKEALWAERLMEHSNDVYMGRRPDAIMKSTIAVFRALTERGLNVGLKEISEYDFSQDDYSGKYLVISHQISVPQRYQSALEHFVSCGGTLIVEGLTAFFDEELHNTMNTGFLFEKLFGGNIAEFKLIDNLFTLQVDGCTLPVHLWQGSIANNPASASTHSYGKGKVIWLPSTIGLGAWLSNNYKPISDYLYGQMSALGNAPSFDGHYSNVLMRTLRSGKNTVVICINKSFKSEVIKTKNLTFTEGVVIYATPGCHAKGDRLMMESEGILVIRL